MAVEFGIITSVVPPGGWNYPQVLSTGATVKITAFSFEQLLESMLDFRRRHPELVGGSAKATIENVRIDLKNHFCAHFRQNCADSHGTPVTQPTGTSHRATYSRPIDKAGDWLSRIGNSKLERVDAALASQRAHVCASCPQNTRWASPCAPCNETIEIKVQNAKGSAHTPYDRHLFVCRAFGHVNEVAVWLADTFSETDQQIPLHCWKLEHG